MWTTTAHSKVDGAIELDGDRPVLTDGDPAAVFGRLFEDYVLRARTLLTALATPDRPTGGSGGCGAIATLKVD